MLGHVMEQDEELQRLLQIHQDLSDKIEKCQQELTRMQTLYAQQVKGEASMQETVAPLENACQTAQEAVERILTQDSTKELPLESKSTIPLHCIPIRADVLTFDWKTLYQSIQFDVIVMDPPWQLATHQPTRGVAIAYEQLPDNLIEEMPIQHLSTTGFIFIWVINNKYSKAFELMQKWGYKYVDDVTWVKQTCNRRMAKGHGYYLQHAKETCLVGLKGTDPPNCQHNVMSDVIYAERRGQSQKPEALYEMIEALIPGGRFLEIFGRRNNLRNNWVTLGNEL